MNNYAPLLLSPLTVPRTCQRCGQLRRWCLLGYGFPRGLRSALPPVVCWRCTLRVMEEYRRARSAANAAKRRALEVQATPRWADMGAIRQFYYHARRLTAETGIKHEVDHFIPLNSPVVCGLHTPLNLRVIPATENREKSNRLNSGDKAAYAAVVPVSGYEGDEDTGLRAFLERNPPVPLYIRLRDAAGAVKQEIAIKRPHVRVTIAGVGDSGTDVELVQDFEREYLLQVTVFKQARASNDLRKLLKFIEKPRTPVRDGDQSWLDRGPRPGDITGPGPVAKRRGDAAQRRLAKGQRTATRALTDVTIRRLPVEIEAKPNGRRFSL